MAFVKLDTGILTSTLWVERECREVFITALLMALPEEITTPMPQIEVRSLELTGFIVPPGWYGFVPAAGIGIIRMALVEREPGMTALEKLGAPDSESRSKDFDGRRLVRIDGGYLVLNFIKYRERDATTADRSRRWRERQKMKEEGVSSRRDITSSRVIRHQAEAEAEAEAEAVTKAKALVSTPAKRGARIAEGWRPDLAGRAFAADIGLDPDSTADAFADYWTAASGRTAIKLDWNAAFRTWCRRAADQPKGRSGNGAGLFGARPTVTVPNEPWEQRLKSYKPGGMWMPLWGPRPESGDCYAPPEILATWRIST